MKFKPAVLVNSIRAQHPSKCRQGVAGMAKRLLVEEEAEERHEQLCRLPTQGDTTRRLEGTVRELWVTAVQRLPSEAMKFALNDSLDTLPNNSNLHMWGKRSSDTCALCSQQCQPILHVLNKCPMAMELRRYSRRHDEVLKVFNEFVRGHLPQRYTITVDLDSEFYRFPQHIVQTNMRPDIVWWSDESRELRLFELTISYESLEEDSRICKQAKYQELVEGGCEKGYDTELITLEVGSRSDGDFAKLRSIFGTSLGTNSDQNNHSRVI